MAQSLDPRFFRDALACYCPTRKVRLRTRLSTEDLLAVHDDGGERVAFMLEAHLEPPHRPRGSWTLPWGASSGLDVQPTRFRYRRTCSGQSPGRSPGRRVVLAIEANRGVPPSRRLPATCSTTARPITSQATRCRL